MATYKVLVINDSRVVRHNIKDMLPAGKLKIVEAKDGIEALNLLNQERPDLILLDFILPKVSGWEVFQHIQTDPELQKIPLVVMSGRKCELTAKIPEPFEHFEFLGAPFDKRTLFSAIKSAIAKARLRKNSATQESVMAENSNQPRDNDAVLGGQKQPPVYAVVLGGIER